MFVLRFGFLPHIRGVSSSGSSITGGISGGGGIGGISPVGGNGFWLFDVLDFWFFGFDACFLLAISSAICSPIAICSKAFCIAIFLLCSLLSSKAFASSSFIFSTNSTL